MTKSTDRIKKIITALLAKARGTDNEHEAETFLAKAMELMQQYQLDIADMVDDGDPVLNHVGLQGAVSGHVWRWRLYRAVGALYGCKGIYVETGYKTDEHGRFVRTKSGKPTETYEYRLVGRESAVITTDLMYPWIVEQVREHARRIVRETAERYGADRAMSEQGQAKRVAAALISRIWKMVEAQKEAAPSTAAGRNALVVMDQVEAAFEQHFPDAVDMKPSRAVSDRASRAAADSINLHRQTGGRSTLRLEHAS